MDKTVVEVEHDQPDGDRRWYKKKRWWAAGLLLIVIGLASNSINSGDPEGAASENASQDSRSATPTAQEEEPELTSAQKTALAEARYRIDSGGLSKTALIQHMTADGYYRANVIFAANNVGADWKEEAVEQARGRLSAGAYPKRSLMEHLWKADGFTRAQAEYAVSKVY